MTAAEVAQKLLEFYDGKPERWTKNALARNAEGYKRAPYQLDACCWCLSGALSRITTVENHCDALQAFAAALAVPNIPAFNDFECDTFADVQKRLEEIAGSV